MSSGPERASVSPRHESLRCAVLVKQVPRSDDLMLREGVLVRDGVELEVNPYCRRANGKAVELAGPDGEVVVFTMGPPAAEDALREMLACGAHRAIHLCAPEFAGSDTLATSRALAKAIEAEGPFDVVLAGLQAVDGDTGQVPPQVAAHLGLPFLPGVRRLEITNGVVHASAETDDGNAELEAGLPVVISAAERLCDPSKAPAELRALVSGDRIKVVNARDLDLSPSEVGTGGSPTSVGATRTSHLLRQPILTSSVTEAITLLDARGALTSALSQPAADMVPETGRDGPEVWCVLDRHSPVLAAELLGECARLAHTVGGSVSLITAEACEVAGELGADRLLVLPDDPSVESDAEVLSSLAVVRRPLVILVEGSRRGRVLASLMAAVRGWGLIGDAAEVDITAEGRLVAWKPALSGALTVAVQSRSPVQVVTVRRGVSPVLQPRPTRAVPIERLRAESWAKRVRVVGMTRTDHDLMPFLRARNVIGVGTGVDPDRYADLDPLRSALDGAPLGATRRVTDRGWLPRSRQIGITGHSIAPHLYVALGISGKFNHMIGVRNAKTIMAINCDTQAPVFDSCDIGIVAQWQAVVHDLAEALVERARTRSEAHL